MARTSHCVSQSQPPPYISLARSDWARLRRDTPLTLSAEELNQLSSLHEPISLQEVEEVYLPLSRLLRSHVELNHHLSRATNDFLRHEVAITPFILGIGGSVAVGKSTTARVLQALMQRWPESPKVDLVTTDGFLLPNKELERRNILNRKGFPESYDTHHLRRVIHDIKAGVPCVNVPLYSHITYDILPGKTYQVKKPDILILEGLNVLQPTRLTRHDKAIPYVSDFFDFSLYLHAEEQYLQSWYCNRFMKLRQTAFQKPESYFHRYATLSDDKALEVATSLWQTINLPNLHENILPTRQRARLIFDKAQDHKIEHITLKRV